MKIQNHSAKIKNSTISCGTCCQGLLYNCRESSTNRPFYAKQSQSFEKSQVYVSVIITKDYEMKIEMGIW